MSHVPLSDGETLCFNIFASRSQIVLFAVETGILGVKQLGPTFRAAGASSGHKNRSTIVIRQARRLFNSRLRKSTNLASAKVASTGSETTLRNSSQKKVKIIDARTIRTIFSVLHQSANVISLVDPVIVFFKTKVKILHVITHVLPM